MPFILLNHVPTWDVSNIYHLQVEHPYRSRLKHSIPYLSIILYVAYHLFSLYVISITIREVFGSLSGVMGRYLDIANRI